MIQQIFDFFAALANALFGNIPPTALMVVGVFGMLLGMLIAFVFILLLPGDVQPRQQAVKPRRQKSPRQHKKETERRAVSRAVTQVASLHVEIPERR